MSVHDTTLPQHMRAIRCHAPKDYRLEMLPTPTPSSLLGGELLIRVSRCGICAGDAKCHAGAPRFWGDATHAAYVETPVTPGHEFCGVVVHSKRAGFRAGEAVTAQQVVACGRCIYCTGGTPWLCGPHEIFGFRRAVPGGLAEFMVFPARAKVYKLPRGLSVAEMAFVEPLSCAVHGVERADVQMGDVVVVGGCGPIGLGMISAARMRGPARVVAVDVLEGRLEVARKCGADVVINANQENVGRLVREITGGYGCDVYLEASGVPDGVKQGLECCRKLGVMVEFSVFKGPTSVDWSVIGDEKELNIRGAHCSGKRGYQVAMDMLDRGVVPVESIVTHSLPLEDVEHGLSLVDHPCDSLKVTVDPQLRT